MATPLARSCRMSRHTSDRLAPSSAAIFVPLTTTVALSVSNRTMELRRRSVACSVGALLEARVEAGDLI